MINRFEIKTKPKELEKFVRLLPDDYEPYFIGIDRHTKLPDVYKGESWKDSSYKLTIEQCLKRLERGLNVAIVMRGKLIAVDIDDIDDVPDLPETLEVMSRNGRSHRFYYNDGNIGNKDITKVVELRTNWRYVLAAGSYVPPSKTALSHATGVYTVIKELPLATLHLEDLPKELHPDFRKDIEDFNIIHDDIWYNVYGDPLKLIRKHDSKLDFLLTGSNMYYRSASEADMATCSKLWFWGYNIDEIASIMHKFRYRDKFDRSEYLGRTIAKVITGDRVSKSLLYDPDEEEETKSLLSNVSN